MGGVNGVVFDVENLPRLSADHYIACAPFDQKLDLASLEIDRGEPRLRRDDQLVAARSVAVLMKVETGPAGIFSQPDHAMAGVRVNPFSRRSIREDKREHEQSYKIWHNIDRYSQYCESNCKRTSIRQENVG